MGKLSISLKMEWYFIGSGQVISWDAIYPGEGYYFIFHPNLLTGTELANRIKNFSFFTYDTHEAHFLNLEEEQNIFGLFERMYVELLEQTKVLLFQTDFSVLEIAYRLGFENASYFSRLFKKKTGLSPSEMKKSLKSASKSWFCALPFVR